MRQRKNSVRGAVGKSNRGRRESDHHWRWVKGMSVTGLPLREVGHRPITGFSEKGVKKKKEMNGDGKEFREIATRNK